MRSSSHTPTEDHLSSGSLQDDMMTTMTGMTASSTDSVDDRDNSTSSEGSVALAKPPLGRRCRSDDTALRSSNNLRNSIEQRASARASAKAAALGASEPNDHEEEEEDDEPLSNMRDPLVPWWTAATQVLHNFFSLAVTTFALHAVKYPKTYLVVITILSLSLTIAGFFTNFSLELNLDTVFTPVGSRPQMHANWIDSDAGFKSVATRSVQMIFHAHGANVLHPVQTRRVLEAVETVRTTPGFWELCAQGVYVNFNNEPTCRVVSSSSYWKNHSLVEFDAQINANDGDATEDLRYVLSGKEFADGSPVLHDIIVGNYERSPETRVLTSAQSYMVSIELPAKANVDDVEADILERLASLRNNWIDQDSGKDDDDPTSLTIDIMTIYAYQLELMRTIIEELWLIPICILLMVGFTCLIFTRWDDRVQSRGFLGLASVITICMSVCTGNGIMFLIGVPYSAVHQMLPFVIFGIGLDDTFIITGSYFRTSPKDPIEDRVRTTMLEVGPSITLTTFTTIFAFFLGRMTSSLPGVHWLCLYAMTIILVDFYYQITYFIAFVVLDERRIQANKKDCCCWITVEREEDSETAGEDDTAAEMDSIHAAKVSQATAAANSIPVRIMTWYSEFLMRPVVKVAVLVVFAAFFGLCCYSATLMEQHFNVVDYVATDSYLSHVFESLDQYSSVVRPMGVYFRDFDQMDESMHKQMIDYVNELEALPQIGASNMSLMDISAIEEVQAFCWVRDLKEIEAQITKEDPAIAAAFADMTFNEKLDFALKDKTFREVYGQDIIRDEAGNVTASRCFLFLKNLDLSSVEAQVDMLFDQRAVTMAQPINQLPQHTQEWALFSFESLFFYWEAYAVAVDELVVTIISGVISVTLIAFIFIPHWSAGCFVLPLILVLYINLLGMVNYFGLDINGLTYICVVVAIGLLVDFLMHILLRYYESRPDQSREDRVKETLQTMGVSILVGGFTTFLGVVPLCLSSVYIFQTVFYAFFAMVFLGVSHGLILLPVILSYVGPTMAVRGHHLAVKPDFMIAAAARKLKDISHNSEHFKADNDDSDHSNADLGYSKAAKSKMACSNVTMWSEEMDGSASEHNLRGVRRRRSINVAASYHDPNLHRETTDEVEV